MKKYLKIFSTILLTLIYFIEPIHHKFNTYIQTFNYSIIDNSGSYIKNSIIPKKLYVISENDMTKAEQTMITTLQGIVSSKSNEQIYILSDSEPDYKLWLEDLKKNYNVKYKLIKDPFLNHM